MCVCVCVCVEMLMIEVYVIIGEHRDCRCFNNPFIYLPVLYNLHITLHFGHK